MDLRPASEPVPLARLAMLTQAVLGDPAAAAALFVGGITVDSRRALPGDLFAALPGEHAHGADFSAQAVRAGAVAALTDSTGLAAVEAAGLVALVVADPRAVVGAVAAEIYGHPAQDLLLLGVTGTNGKTTTTWLIEAGLRAAGHRTGLVGTVETRIADEPVASARTTPEATELHALLAVMKERGVTAVAIEVSSHALTLGRVDGCIFDVVGFTQFGSDHLDFHPSVEEYFQAKAQLFTPSHAKLGVVCIDSAGGQRIVIESGISTTSLSTSDEPADWQVTEITPIGVRGYNFQMTGPNEFDGPTGIQLPGRFNVANAALARAMLHVAGVPDGAAAEGIRRCRGVPGRMDVVDEGQAFLALVDYAHTPDALAAVLASLRPEATGQLILVVGCGGDRDPTKRPSMGRIAAQFADLLIVTDDNPRSEDPGSIRAAVMAGAEGVAPAERARVIEIAGRTDAIRRAVGAASPGDVVLVAGKGHEAGQEVDGHVQPFDDRTVLVDTLRSRRAPTDGVGPIGAHPEDLLQPEEER
jgi:UDP-N-acetylmuramoyl-L-alanyl-D-glutamate--2,6-diaminopimelate ligase